MAISLLKKQDATKGLFPVEVVGVIYTALTTLFLLLFWAKMDHPGEMLLDRLYIVAGMVALIGVYKLYPCRLTTLMRCGYQLALLSYWYPDTYEFNRYLPNLDHLFASAEQWLFGCQPALVFCRNFPQLWVSEPLNLGYFSYYPMIASVALWYFIRRYDLFQKWTFVLATSFFVYYLIYIILPVTGPQFYFPAIGEQNVLDGVFPAVGDYFNTHRELLPGPDYEHGFFYSLVEGSQQVGERPTAAFPSSHVGISTILMFMAFRGSKRLFGFLFPFYVLLCVATVYIQAHYVIDAMAGFISAFLIYAFTSWLYRKFFSTSSRI